jgi:uncharacterized protein (TIGR02466 family)
MNARLTYLGKTLLAFPTPIQRVRYERIDEFNAEVARRVLSLREKSAGLERSNVGGWHSEATILKELGEPYGTQLGKMFIENVKAAFGATAEMTDPWPTQFSMDAWANVNQRGDTNSPHIHPGCPWSGVYYVATDDGAGGEIVFTDPRTAALMVGHPLNPFAATNQVKIAPLAGMMLVFPAFLYHSVRAYEGESPRISIAFNLR